MSEADHGRGAVFKLFREVAELPAAERKAALMPRLDALWETAMGRTYESAKHGTVANPDVATALRVVEVADALLCEVGEKTNKLAALKLFDSTRQKAG